MHLTNWVRLNSATLTTWFRIKLWLGLVKCFTCSRIQQNSLPLILSSSVEDEWSKTTCPTFGSRRKTEVVHVNMALIMAPQERPNWKPTCYNIFVVLGCVLCLRTYDFVLVSSRDIMLICCAFLALGYVDQAHSHLYMYDKIYVQTWAKEIDENCVDQVHSHLFFFLIISFD